MPRRAYTRFLIVIVVLLAAAAVLHYTSGGALHSLVQRIHGAPR